MFQSNQLFEMQSSLEHYNEHTTTLKMTTGSSVYGTSILKENPLPVAFELLKAVVAPVLS
ncbi:MAG TPA: hypothetical protein VFD60_07175 [Nitrososphaeraceae archaeon]|jgi:hypothetical protein|nr:hypothetical protein [Nitrososphaeraceae archaeon]